ncbi:MAG TPA: CHAT domain-containing tetratricopeptide repeat protein [Chitinophagaceae bacterium]|nr:CHAT domain-containing tetratricopeptide repeat protein [Chitinophagaceae bacterium]
MGKKWFITIILISLPILPSLFAQCPINDSLWKRLVFLRDGSHSISTSDQLGELIKYENLIDHCSFRYDSTHALLLQRIGAMYYRQTDYLKAMEYMVKSIKIVRAHLGGPSVNPRFLIVDYYSLSFIYGALGLTREKVAALDSCEMVSQRLQYVDPLVLYAIFQKVEYYMGTGDFHRCINYADKCTNLAIDYYKSIPDGLDKMNEYVSGCFVWKVNALMELNEYQIAEQLLVQKIKEYRKIKDAGNLGAMYGLLATTEAQFGKYDNAIKYFQQALDYDRQIGFDLGCMTILSNLAYSVYYLHFNDYDKANIAYKKALKFINKNPVITRKDSFESLNILANIANVFVRQKKYDSAFKYFQLSFDQIKRGIDEVGVLNSSGEDLIQSEEVRYLVELVITKADAKQKQYDETADNGKIKEAIRVYRTADQLLERIRAGQSEFESKLYWRNMTRRLYENAIEACFKSGDMADGFYFFERSRAVLLVEQLNERKWLGENEILNMAQVKKKLFQKRKELLSHDPVSKEYTDLQKEINLETQELDRLMDLVRTRNPVYYKTFIDTGFINLSQVRMDLMKDHQALLEFYSGDSAIYTLIITPTSALIKKISKSIYEDLVKDFNAYVSNPGLLNKEFPIFCKISRQLYQLIFQDNPVPAGRIIISPDGQYFPIEALIVNDKKIEYFVSDHAVSYTYSARFLLYQFENSSKNATRDFVGIAPITYPVDMNLQALSGSDASLIKMKSFFKNSSNLIGKDASKENFLKQLAMSKVVQLYTHALGSSITGDPEIWFADSALYLSELVEEQRPVTDLIVLSACQTALGKDNKGEGIFSFNRGFAAFGIPSSISNLWSVDDKSSYKLTELFYQYLSGGEPIDIALQKAKIKFMSNSSRQDSLPYFWAASILAGRSNSLNLRKRFPGNALIILVSLGVIAFISIWYWKR